MRQSCELAVGAWGTQGAFAAEVGRCLKNDES